MTRKSQFLATCSAMPVADGDGVPEWVNLLPAGEIRTGDGRGPYRVVSMHAVAGMLKDGDKLPLDECHSTDRAQPRGEPAPARGWIVALEARETGLWGKVEWTGEGRRLMEDKAYRGISPVILHSKDNEVLAVLRASLTNTPNLTGLVALHTEEGGMDWKAKLIELLGLDSDADNAAIAAALTAKLSGNSTSENSLQLGNEAVIALQSELAGVTAQLNALREERASEQAVAFVDGAIAQGRVGLKALRDDYVALHMSDPDRAKKLIGGMPVLKGSTHTADLPPEVGGNGLDAGDRQVIALMGLSEEEYAASLKASGVRKEVL